MSAKDVSVNSCLGLLEKLGAFKLSDDKILEGANNVQKSANSLCVIDGLDKIQKHFESIQSYVGQSILKSLNDNQDKLIIIIHQDVAFTEVNVLSALSALAYDKGDTSCLQEIADQCQHHVGVGHLMNNLGVMLIERMEYKRSEICFVRAKSCFEDEHDHLGNAVATLNLAILNKLFGDYQSALSCCDAAASLCHDVSMRTTKDVHLPWKVLTRVAVLCQEFGNYKKCQDILHIGVFYDISGACEGSQVNLTKQLMALQLKEQNREKIQDEQLEEIASCLFALLDQSCTENLPKNELINADFITIVITVAKMYRDIDHLEEACKLLNKLETTFKLVLGGMHSLYGPLLYQIGSFKLGAGNTDEAVKTLQQAEAIFIHYFGKGHHMVASCKSLLGTCALVKGQNREASTLLHEAQVFFKKMNHHHPEVAEILLKCALLSSEEGNFQNAETMVQEAVDIFTSACGEVSPKTGSAYIQAAAILQKTRESRASAVENVKKAIDIFRQLGLRSDHPDVKTCQTLRGVLELSLGQTEDAEEQFSKVQQVPLQDKPCLTAKIVAPENTNMLFKVKTDFGRARYMGSGLRAQVVSLVNLVDMKKGEERRNHLNQLLRCLQGHETKEPLMVDFAGQIVYYMSHRVWAFDSYDYVYCILTWAPPPDCFQNDHGLNSDYATRQSDSSEEPNVFLLSSSNCHGKSPCSLVFWKTSKVLEMKELRSVNSAFRESVDMLFLQPKFRKGYLEGQDFYIELTLPQDCFASFSLCTQIDHLPLLVEQKLSDPNKECGSIDSVVHTSLISAVKLSTHVSYFSYRFVSRHQAELVFHNLISSLGQTLALTKVEGVEITNASAVQNGVFFLLMEPNNSSLSVVVEKEFVLVKCRTVKEFDSTCICSLVRNTVEGTIESLCHTVRVTFEPSMELPCVDVGGDNMKESANCSCGCKDSWKTLDLHACVRSQEPESNHHEGKPSAVQVSQNERRKDILFASYPDDQTSTDVCLSLLECLLSNRNVSSEVQPSDTGEILSTDSSCLDENRQLDSSMLSPGSMSSLNLLPTSPSNAVYEMPVFVRNMSPPLLKVAAEPRDEKDDSNNDNLSENSSTACVGYSESSSTLQEVSNSPVGENLLKDSSAMRSSYEEGLLSEKSPNDAETTETLQLKDDTLSEEEIQILKCEVLFSQNQCHELRQQVVELKEQLQQYEAEKQHLELELGWKSFLEDKQKRSKKVLLSSRAHVSEQNKSCTASGASYNFTSMEGKLLGGASLLQEQGFSLQGRLLEISNALSEAELKQMKFLARPKVNAFRLKKIREGFKLFEELETNGELSCTYVRELLEGIQRFDLLQKLDLHEPDNAESGDKKQDVLPRRHDDPADEPSDGIHLGINKADSGCNMASGNSENGRCDAVVLSANSACDYSSVQSESSAEEHTRFPDSSYDGFLSNESSSTAVSSSELSANSAMMAESFKDDSTSSSCTSQDVCNSSPRVIADLPFAVRNHESSGDSSYNPTTSEEEILERSLLPNDTGEWESGGMDTTEGCVVQDGRVDEVLESSGDVWYGLMKPHHLELRSASGAGKDVVDSGPLHNPARVQSASNLRRLPGLMKDALPDGDIAVGHNASRACSSVGKDSAADHSVTGMSSLSTEWKRLGARPRDKPPVKMAPLAPSLVDLVPQEVAGPVAHGVADAFLARHSQDRGLHESLYQGSVEKVLSNDNSSQGTSCVDGMMNLRERNKAKPYAGECQADVHSRLPFPLPPLLGGTYDSQNAVGGYAYNEQFNAHTGLVSGPPSSYFTGSNFLGSGPLPSSSTFNSSNYNSFRSGFVLGTNRPSGMGHFDRGPHSPFDGQVGSGLFTHFGNGTEPQLPPPVHGTQRLSGFNENTSKMASDREKTQTARAANSGLGNQLTGNVADVNVGSSGLPAPLTFSSSNGADNRRELEAESSATSQSSLGTARRNALNSSGDRAAAGANRDISSHFGAGLASEDSRVTQLLASNNADANHELQGTEALLSATSGGSMLNRDFGTDSVESTDNSLLALEQRVEEACALVERVLREREEREEFGREIERKEREIREQRARKRREREARELEEASRWPQQQEQITGRSQWLCEHYQRHCRVRFPCCSHFYSCHRCHNNSKACDNEEAKASHATHLKCAFCQHEQEIGEDSGKCRSCGAQMSAYFCSICKHFTSVDKNPYHCKKCGICRIHKDKSFHCEVCNVCLDKRLEGKHKCRADSGHDECCICLEDAFSGCQILPCSHKVHRECAIAMIQNGIRTCPVCRHPLYSPASE